MAEALASASRGNYPIQPPFQSVAGSERSAAVILMSFDLYEIPIKVRSRSSRKNIRQMATDTRVKEPSRF
jgi:hypothetical protein